jgi:predicted phage tail component-like protein
MIDLLATLRGFTFNDKHNYKDMGVVMESRSIQSPSKKKIKDSVPFMNGSYDFSTVGTNGEIVYNEREITVVIAMPEVSKEMLQIVYSRILEWIADSGKCKLVFDDIIDYYFMAEVEDTSSFEEVMAFGKLTVKFTADPFKTSVDNVGDDIWDTFNFEEDWVQDVEFDVSGTKNIQIYNPGRLTRPTINCSTSMTAMINGYTANLAYGDNKNWLFKLKNGVNDITINGTGHIKFIFRKEQL